MQKYVWIAVAAAAIIGLVVWIKGGEKLPDEPQVTSQPKTVQENTPAQDTTTPVNNNQQTNNKKTVNGMTIETTVQGSGPEIKNGQTAVVQYEGKLTDGTIFDSTAKHGGTQFEFPLGAGMVIKGWDQGVLGMKVGETRILTIPSELGYGATGAGNVIPPNATLIFKVTLQGIK